MGKCAYVVCCGGRELRWGTALRAALAGGDDARSSRRMECGAVASLLSETERVGAAQFVLLSSIHVCRPRSLAAVIFDSAHDGVLRWKLEAERLVRSSRGLPYTIARLGGLETQTGLLIARRGALDNEESAVADVRVSQGGAGPVDTVEPHEAARLLLYCLGNTAALATTFECVRWSKDGGEQKRDVEPAPAIYEQVGGLVKDPEPPLPRPHVPADHRTRAEGGQPVTEVSSGWVTEKGQQHQMSPPLSTAAPAADAGGGGISTGRADAAAAAMIGLVDGARPPQRQPQRQPQRPPQRQPQRPPLYAPWCRIAIERTKSRLAGGPLTDAFGEVHAVYRLEVYEIGRAEGPPSAISRPTGALWACAVYRRFSDFVALDGRLRHADVLSQLELQRTYYLGPEVEYGKPPPSRQRLPVLPPKRLMRTCDETLTERILGLRAYLDAALQARLPAIWY